MQGLGQLLKSQVKPAVDATEEVRIVGQRLVVTEVIEDVRHHILYVEPGDEEGLLGARSIALEDCREPIECEFVDAYTTSG